MTFYVIKCIKTCQREQVNKFSQPTLLQNRAEKGRKVELRELNVHFIVAFCFLELSTCIILNHSICFSVSVMPPYS